MNFNVGYKYDKNTKQFLKQVECQQSPQRPGTWLMPPCVTLIQPIQIQIGKARIFNEQKQQWQYVVDNRNKTMYLKQKSLITSQTPNGLFDTIPDQYTLVLPPDNQKWYKFKDNQWEYYFQPVTKQYLYDLTYKKKCQIAYGGIFIIKDWIQYKFQTSQDSITMCNSTVIRLQNSPDDTQINWKTWINDQPAILVLTKTQFINVFGLGLNMVNESFVVEGNLNAEIMSMTQQQLANEQFVNSFKEKIITQFENIQRTFDINTL